MQTIQSILRKYRNEIKGVAILWVVFFHAKLGLSEGLLYDIQKIGYGGVDLFLLLMGFGLYHSLSKDADLSRYLKRRALRIFPAYFPFCIAWLLVMIPLYGKGAATSIRIAAGNLSMLGFFADVPLMINWYISVLALALLLAPLVYAVLTSGQKTVLRAAMLLLAAFVTGLCFVGNDIYMAVSRFPVFIIGMLLAIPLSREINVRKMAAFLAAAAVMGLGVLYVCFARFPELLNDYAMYWHPFVLIAPGLCAGLGWLFSKCHSSVGRPFAVLGKASFEIFLFNAWIERLGKYFGLAKTPVQWLFWSAASIAAGLAYHAIVSKIVKKVVDKAAA